MTIEKFTEADISEAALLAYPVWGVGHAANGQGEAFGLLMCEYIVRYGWYGAPYAFNPSISRCKRSKNFAAWAPSIWVW